MIVEKIKIQNIPAIIFGEKSDKIYIYVHGKMSCKKEAFNFAEIALNYGYQTLSFDLPEHGDRKDNTYLCDVQNSIYDLNVIADYVFSLWENVNLFACSLGAYFSLNAYAKRPFQKCLFQSPILDMYYLINQMFNWFNITEERLIAEKKIYTPIDILRINYYQYVKEHPIDKWPIPTSILYAGKDNLQPIKIIKKFVKTNNCELTISPTSEHPFLQNHDLKILNTWFESNIRT